MSKSKNKKKYVLFYRYYDSSRKQWTEWQEVSGVDLKRLYGETLEEWKKHCKSWIECGGTYQYKIYSRVDTVEWEMSYLDNKEET